MPTSDSEDFESADEGHASVEKKERKKRKSSSNYSDNALAGDGDAKNAPAVSACQDKPKEETDGWDDFEIDETSETQASAGSNITDKPSSRPAGNISNNKPMKSQDTGWDEFEDWGDEDTNNKDQNRHKQQSTDKDIKEVTERLAAASTTAPSSGSGGWGWGWGVDSLLSSATAGISNLTSQVSQGITTVLETGIGAPDPEELARKTVVKEKEETSANTPDGDTVEKKPEDGKSSGDGVFAPLGSILSFVGSTGSKVIAGGLDTLETIGRKTMDLLQEGDPYLEKKRALLGLEPGVPILSAVLREAKAKAEEEDRIKEEKREAKEVHYENLFDDFEGLVHLEALEMLSKQIHFRIEEKLRDASKDEKQSMNETLYQVIQLCELPEEEDEEENEQYKDMPKVEAFHERLQKATEDLGVKLQFQPLVKQYSEILDWLQNSESDFSFRGIYKKAISNLAQSTALCMEIYHKVAEMIVVIPRRSTPDEAEAITKMTVVLTRHVGDIATLFTEKIDSLATQATIAEARPYMTNIFYEAGNSVSYIHNAFLLTQPIIQIGAV